MLGSTLAVAAKDLRIVFKDKGSLAVLFLLPLLFAVIFGAPQHMSGSGGGSGEGLGGEPSFTASAQVVNQDSGPYGSQVVGALSAVRVLDLAHSDSVSEADRFVADGKVPAAIVIPADFSQRIDSGEATRIQIIADPAQAFLADMVTGIVNQAAAEIAVLGEIKLGIRTVLEQSGILKDAAPDLRRAAEAQTLGVVWTQVEQMRRNPLIEVRSENLIGEQAESSWNVFSYYSPSFGVMFAFFLVGFVASSILQEREDGLLYRLVSSPIPAASIIAGKMLAYGAIAVLQMFMMFAVGSIAFGMPLGSSPLGLILITLALVAAATSMGMLVGALARSSSQADSLGVIIGIVLMLVGGCVFPLFRAGGAIAAISYLTPHAHALSAYMGIMADGKTLAQVVPHILALIGFAGVFFGIAAWRFRFE